MMLFVTLSSILLITINFYTIKILSGVRAYINGESEYSKGQKDASLFLATYINLGDEQYYTSFKKSIDVPGGDKLARVSLQGDKDDSIIFRGFIAGHNHGTDIPDMIWLFRSFQSMPFMKEAISIWSDGDVLTDNLRLLGEEVHNSIAAKSFTDKDKELKIKRIDALSVALSKKESAFSAVLGNVARKINTLLLIANILCVIVIISSITLYMVGMINKVIRSKKVLENKNAELATASKELDTFVYSISHDLRSPITSIKGLLYIAKEEDDLVVLKEHLNIIEDVIDKQDEFIKEIISFFKNKRSSLVMKDVSLTSVIDDVIKNNRYTPLAQQMIITKDVGHDMVYSDELRLKMILNNLLSNSIKYCDEQKDKRMVAIRTSKVDDKINIEVEDNGVGIDREYFDKIFQMFYVTPNNIKGTGLGLYILQQSVEKLDGAIKVESEVNVGTKFTISIPHV